MKRLHLIGAVGILAEALAWVLAIRRSWRVGVPALLVRTIAGALIAEELTRDG